MQPIRIRYHEPTSPEVSVIRYNDPLVKQHRNLANEFRPEKRQHRLRENKSDFDYDYGPARDDFEHMRHSVPEQYWGPYNPRLYDRQKHWEDNEDDKYYNFKFDSYRKHRFDGDNRDQYQPDYHPRKDDRRYRGDYETQTVPPLPLARRERGFNSDRRLTPADHEYHSHRPGYGPAHDRHDRYPVRGSYEPGYENPYQRRGRSDFYHRPQVAQSEVILPRNRVRPVPYVEEPNRNLFELRRVSEEPIVHQAYDYDPRYHPEERVYYPAYRSEVSDKYLVSYPRLKEPPEPRVALVTIPRPAKHHIGYLEAPPEKKSKYIPHMHYEGRRCPHCNDRIRTNHEPDVLAYPWTVQTFPARIPISTAKASVITPSIRTGTVQVGANNSKISVGATEPVDKTGDKNASKDDKNKANTTDNDKTKSNNDPKKSAPTKPETKGKENKTDDKNNKEDKKAGKPKAGETKDKNGKKKPLSETGNVTNSKPLSKSGDDVKEQNKAVTRASQKKRNLETVHERSDENTDKDSFLNINHKGFEDDIRPQDSISNVDAQPLRAYPRGPNNTEHRRFYQARAQAVSPASGYSYPSGRYFPRLEYISPPRARGTPLPMYARPIEYEYRSPHRARETPMQMWARPMQPTRKLYGRYYDRQDGRIYDYDVNYDGNRIYGDRRLLLR